MAARRLADEDYAARVRKAVADLQAAIDAAYQAGLDVEVSVHESWALVARAKGRSIIQCAVARPL